MTSNSNKEFIFPENAFYELTFDEFFQNASQIKLSNNAFGSSASTIKSINSPYPWKFYINHSPLNFDIWKVFSGLTNLESLTTSSNIKEIPTHAFIPLHGVQSRLNYIRLLAYQQGARLSIRKMAFYDLEHLKEINIHNYEIGSIESSAFALSKEKKSNERLEINFWCKFKSDAFKSGSFTGLQRPVKIQFNLLSSVLHNLPETVFTPVLDNPASKILIQDGTIDCNDCANYWLIRDRKESQVDVSKGGSCAHNHCLNLFSLEIKLDLAYKCDPKFKEMFAYLKLKKFLNNQITNLDNNN